MSSRVEFTNSHFTFIKKINLTCMQLGLHKHNFDWLSVRAYFTFQ